jgi:hypothetical protein
MALHMLAASLGGAGLLRFWQRDPVGGTALLSLGAAVTAIASSRPRSTVIRRLLVAAFVLVGGGLLVSRWLG